jgi:hypothetical protein
MDMALILRSGRASMIRRYLIWRNDHAQDHQPRRIIAKANVA